MKVILLEFLCETHIHFCDLQRQIFIITQSIMNNKNLFQSILLLISVAHTPILFVSCNNDEMPSTDFSSSSTDSSGIDVPSGSTSAETEKSTSDSASSADTTGGMSDSASSTEDPADSSTTGGPTFPPCNPFSSTYHDQHGEGSKTSPYEICTADQLYDLAAQDEKMNFHAMQSFYILKNKIDVSHLNAGWSIGKQIPFTGSFEGDGYEIEGFKNSQEMGGGLFNTLSGNATIHNLTLTNANLHTNGNAGLLVDTLVDFTGTLENLSIKTGTVQSYSNSQTVVVIGGLVGQLNHSVENFPALPKLKNLSVNGLQMTFAGNYQQIESIGGVFGQLHFSKLDANSSPEFFSIDDSHIKISSTWLESDELNAHGIGGLIGNASNVRLIGPEVSKTNIEAYLTVSNNILVYSSAILGGAIGKGKNLTLDLGQKEVQGKTVTVHPKATLVTLKAQTGGLFGGFIGECFSCHINNAKSSLVQVTLMPSKTSFQSHQYIGGFIGSIFEPSSIHHSSSKSFNVLYALPHNEKVENSISVTVGGLAGSSISTLSIDKSYGQTQYGSMPDLIFDNGIQTSFGGFVGYASPDSQVNVLNSFALVSTDSGVDFSGGLVGGTPQQHSIQNSYVAGKISMAKSMNYSHHGGLVSNLSIQSPYSPISNSWAAIEYTGAINEQVIPHYTGGIIGSITGTKATWLEAYSVIKNVYFAPQSSLFSDKTNEKNIPALACVSLAALQKLDLKSDIAGCFLADDSLFTSQEKLTTIVQDWDFNNVWQYVDGFPYPLLQGLEQPQ